MEKKLCLKCNKKKSVNSFYNHTKTSSGKTCYCKLCCDVMSAEYRKTESWKIYIRNYMKERYANKESHRKYMKSYMEKYLEVPEHRMYYNMMSMMSNEERKGKLK